MEKELEQKLDLLQIKIDYISDLMTNCFNKLGCTEEVDSCLGDLNKALDEYEKACVEINENPNAIHYVALDNEELSDGVKHAVKSWLDYKTERGDTYTEKGYAQLIRQVKKEVKDRGEDTAILKINTSIENKWQGICWESSIGFRDEIVNMFEKTFELTPNKNKAEGAKRVYMDLFKDISDKEKALHYGRVIYTVFKKYIEETDEKYIANFKTWLENEVPKYKK